MKKAKDKPAPVLVARIPNNRRGRAALAVLRDGMNRDGYRLRVLFSGPREPGAYGTVKENAHTFRVYMDRQYPAGYVSPATRAWKAESERDTYFRISKEVREYSLILAKERDEERQHAMSAESERDEARAECENWVRHGAEQACKLSAANQRAAKLADITRRTQAAYNAIPAWCLWLAGAVREARIRGRLLWRMAEGYADRALDMLLPN